MANDISLIVGKEYSVGFHPDEKIAQATYLGEGELEGFGKNHLFFSEESDETYIWMSDHNIEERDGIINYSPFSSAPVGRATRKDLRRILDREKPGRVLKFIQSLGEEI